MNDIALLRVINTPPRGIGKTTVDSLSALAREHGHILVGGPRKNARALLLRTLHRAAQGFPEID